MDRRGAPCPAWMVTRFEQQGGTMAFRQFMQLALHDPDHGAYGSGQLKVGPSGDFATSPSLGPDFAELLALQLIQWFDQLASAQEDQCLSLVEVGPGEGDLCADLIKTLQREAPPWLDRLEVVLVELNPGMETRQRQRLEGAVSVPLRWCTLESLASQPVCGVVLAHELLDALPVERLIWRDGELRQMGVSLQRSAKNEGLSLVWMDQQLPDHLRDQLSWAQQRCNLALPPKGASDGWCSEWHSEIPHWLHSAAQAMEQGVLLIVDYALEAHRYYTSMRREGTLLAYRQQRASNDLLAHAGNADLTAHLCLETLLAFAKEGGWSPLGHCRQGEALLSLGLAERLHQLQQLPASELSTALQRREALLRLVDPAALGEFRWIVLQKDQGQAKRSFPLTTCCLQGPAIN